MVWSTYIAHSIDIGLEIILLREWIFTPPKFIDSALSISLIVRIRRLTLLRFSPCRNACNELFHTKRVLYSIQSGPKETGQLTLLGKVAARHPFAAMFFSISV